jgi:hypothetical protein
VAGQRRKTIDDALVLALACGATVESAAQRAEVSERTVFRRLADPAFQERVRATRLDMTQRTSGMLTAASLEAVKTLVLLLQPSSSASVRRNAARDILELGLKLREGINLEERLATVETRVAQAIGGGQTGLAPNQ